VNTKLRVGGALLLGAGIVVGAAYVRANPSENVASAITAVPGQASDTLRTYIQPSDADDNGTPDWQQGVDTVVADVSKDAPELDLSGDTSVDSTMTGTFARSFFEQYFNKIISGGFTDTDLAQFIGQNVEQAAAETNDTLYTKKDIVIGEDTPDAERAYGNAVAAAISRHGDTGEEGELQVFGDMLQGDENAKAKLTNIKEAYGGLLADTLKIPVPPTYVGAHLILVNAYQALENDVDAMVNMNDDALYTLLRLRRHEDDAEGMYDALTEIYGRLYANGVRYASDEPASIITVHAP
jgi:hypothetical protein